MSSPILQRLPLGFPWVTFDPFLFCVHHNDAYPAGNEHLGPAQPLDGRNIGQDFEGKDGWRMYHGHDIPGFPGHPHRGFETVTVVRTGLIDHSDSMGAAARYGNGDVQWLTAGAGIVHAEMFPLLHRDRPNPAELFQIWVNLPPEDKLAPPHFAMFWNDDIPRLSFEDPTGKKTQVTLIAGSLEGASALAPPPRSWAARADSDVAIWTLKLEPGASWTVPPAKDRHTTRTLYFFDGDSVRVADTLLEEHQGLRLQADVPVRLEAGPRGAELLLLQGRPIAKPVAQYGPFVMNTRAELQQAFEDYQRTRFGGWPWDKDDPVFAPSEGRFARFADGRTERPTDGRSTP